MHNKFLREIASKIGIDKSIFYTSSARIVQALGGIISVVLIVRYLTDVEQGFYYTFGSVVALQAFFELGFNGIITQYVAYEVSELRWDDQSRLVGEKKYLSRLSSLLHFSVRWYLGFSILLLFVLVLGGGLFFSKYNVTGEHIDWEYPWILLAIGTVLNLFMTPLLSYIEGLGFVKDIAKLRFLQQILSTSFLWIGIILGLKLYISGIIVLFGFLFSIWYLWHKGFFQKVFYIWRFKISEQVIYVKEIFPYQWKIALSWISGYLVFQLFNPILFATEGAVVAGQMGITLAALGGIKSLSISWITTKIPLFSQLIAKKKFLELDTLFKKTVNQSVSINGFALLIMLLCVFIIRYFQIEVGHVLLSERILGYVPIILMIIPLFFNQYVDSWGIYLRCHKKEPYLVYSLIVGLSCCISTFLFGKLYGVIGITVGYFIINLLLFPMAYNIYKSKKNSWHN